MAPNRPTTQGIRARALLLAVVGGIVFGIVGMHGLSLIHSHSEVMASAAVVAPAHGMGAAAMHTAVLDGGSHQGHEPSGHDDCGLIACCLAVLFGGALLLWAVLSLRRQRPVAWIKRASATLHTSVTSVLRPPPDLISLSILRC